MSLRFFICSNWADSLLASHSKSLAFPCEMGQITTQNGSFSAAKWVILQDEMTDIAR
mgnify:CR=1 FL=1